MKTLGLTDMFNRFDPVRHVLSAWCVVFQSSVKATSGLTLGAPTCLGAPHIQLPAHEAGGLITRSVGGVRASSSPYGAVVHFGWLLK